VNTTTPGVPGRAVEAGGTRWHLRTAGERGPRVLLLHGTGASGHSFEPLLAHLAPHARLLIPDLPGCGDSAPLSRSATSLPGFAAALGDLLEALAVRPDVIVGHSAGAAVAMRAVLDGRCDPARLVGLAPAVLRLPGVGGVVFAPLARLAARGDWLPRLVARRARSPGAVARMVRATGSSPPAAQIEAYGRLLRRPEHVAGALAMMAGWDLAGLEADLARLRTPVDLILGGADATLPADWPERLRRALPGARPTVLDGLGHLAHEEAPARIAPHLLAAIEAADGGREE
jgi:magnesium chelatase accessory protein